MDCRPPVPGGAPPSPESLRASGRGGHRPRRVLPCRPPQPRRQLSALARAEFVPRPSPAGQGQWGGYLPPPSAKPAWCGDPVEPRGPAQPHRGDRVPLDSDGPRSRLPSPEERVPGSALQAGRGQEGDGAAELALPGRSGSGAPPLPRAGGGRAGQGSPPRASAAPPRAGSGSARLRCGRSAAESCGDRLGSPRGGG